MTWFRKKLSPEELRRRKNERGRAYQKKNRERAKEYLREWQRNNREKCRAYTSKYQKTHTDKVNDKNRKDRKKNGKKYYTNKRNNPVRWSRERQLTRIRWHNIPTHIRREMKRREYLKYIKQRTLYHKRYYLAHVKLILAYAKVYRLKNVGWIQAQRRNYYRLNRNLVYVIGKLQRKERSLGIRQQNLSRPEHDMFMATVKAASRRLDISARMFDRDISRIRNLVVKNKKEEVGALNAEISEAERLYKRSELEIDMANKAVHDLEKEELMEDGIDGEDEQGEKKTKPEEEDTEPETNFEDWAGD